MATSNIFLELPEIKQDCLDVVYISTIFTQLYVCIAHGAVKRSLCSAPERACERARVTRARFGARASRYCEPGTSSRARVSPVQVLCEKFDLK